ncbi:hypothetical protein PIB30_086275 [Stylosanthes scabra]|uniref:Uncharacterized protein n=1 Tax=Stylosanthes scabra TaxID=79078 RepID=A0ABU6UVS7_9FABA|nr:hypothetical protein [Stylosanthes scabra]
METDHDIIRKPWLLEKIRYDLLLLENQIPFFVLEKLWDLAFQSSLLNGDNSLSLLELACYYLCPMEPIVLESSIRVAHFTDMNRIFCLKPFNRNLSRTNEVPTLHYSASELNEAGVKFKVNREEKSLLELKFSGKCLQVPEIEVDDGTETWFRNMVALEQCHYLEESYITDYVIFIGHLVNEGKDVDVLVKNKIIVNRLGDNETVAELFRGLKRDIMVMNSDAEYTHICNQLNAYYENFWHKMMATLRIDYFSTPWKTAASVAAIILLIFTAIQTVCSVLSTVKY